MYRRSSFLAVGVLLLGGFAFLGPIACDREASGGDEAEASAESATPSGSQARQGSGPGHDEEGDEHGHEHGESEHGEEEGHGHGHGHGGLRLGLKMQDIGHRFAAIWYAGRAERTEMLDYQLHELRETGAQIKRADIEEHGVDVGAQLDAYVLSKLEGLEKAVEKGDVETFETRYQAMRKRCNTCHQSTEHGFIEVTVPTRNPYPNVDLGSEK